jgi:hypothetical protein
MQLCACLNAFSNCMSCAGPAFVAISKDSKRQVGKADLRVVAATWRAWSKRFGEPASRSHPSR